MLKRILKKQSNFSVKKRKKENEKAHYRGGYLTQETNAPFIIRNENKKTYYKNGYLCTFSLKNEIEKAHYYYKKQMYLFSKTNKIKRHVINTDTLNKKHAIVPFQ